jgi:hypothetical protein
VDAAVARQPIWPPGWLRWGMASACAGIALWFAAVHLRQAPAVEASTLLRKAVAAESGPAARKPHRLRTRQRNQTVAPAAAFSLPPEVSTLFIAANYDALEPLSAKAFETWRETLPRKNDEVLENQAENSYRVHTSTDSGELTSATLTLRMTDLHATAGRFEFRNQDWVELTEVPDDFPAGTPARADGLVPPAPGNVLPPAPALPHSSASAAEELQVVAALHRAGADLGDPVEVSRAPGRIVVTGTGLSPERQRELRSALEDLPNVALQFPDVGPVATPGDAPVPDAQSSQDLSTSSDLSSRLEAQLGGSQPVENFSAQVLEHMEGAMTRAYALRRLAIQFPAETEARLSPADRTILRDLARDHLSTLRLEFVQLDHLILPVLASLAQVPAPPAPPSAATWQESVEAAFQAARRAEMLSSSLVGAATARSANIPVDLTNAMAVLRANLERCERLLARTP